MGSTSLLYESFTVDNALEDTTHNQRARIVRSGLAISLFNTLEQFLKDRFGELTEVLALSRIPYDDFPDALKELFTVRAVQGLNGHLIRSERVDRLNIAQQAVVRLGSIKADPRVLSPHGLGFERPNVQADDVVGVLKRLGIESPWEKMKAAAARGGATRISLDSDFHQIAKFRHEAAHNPSTNIASTDLEVALSGVRAIALGFDLLCTAAIDAFRSQSSIDAVRRYSKDPVLRMRFLDEVRIGTWGERAEHSARFRKKYRDFSLARSAVAVIASRRRETVIVRTAAEMPVEWFA